MSALGHKTGQTPHSTVDQCYLWGLGSAETRKSFHATIEQARQAARSRSSLRRSIHRWVFANTTLAVTAALFAGVWLTVAHAWLALTVTILWAWFIDWIFVVHTTVVRGPDSVIKDRFGLPNGLTTGRLMLTPVVALYLSRPNAWGRAALPALLILLIVGMTDVLDGNLARLLHMKTDFGRDMDPMTDIVVTTASALSLGWAGIIPWWLAALVAFRYLGALAGFILTSAYRRLVPVGSTIIGKVCTPAVQLTFFALILSNIRPDLALSAHWLNGLKTGIAVLIAINIVLLAAFGLRTKRRMAPRR